ncbi:MAG TPA: methyl-accepting chemotaxis protein [Burkholderiaceae bacterium]|nr:methyl-accepting chemotaxis protein [Burkholderiaceae bacterium]
MNKRHSIKTILILSTSMVLIIAQMVSGLVQYHEESAMARNQIRAVAEQAVQPLMNLATDAINGGNMMILTNKEAGSLFDASGALFVRMDGTSTGAPKTEWSDAIPPQKIEHEFVAKDQNATILSGAAQSTGLLEDQLLYVVRTELESVTNGGQLTAVFSAAELDGLKGQVAKRVASISLLIIFCAIMPIWWLGGRIARPLETVVSAAEYVIQNDDFSRTIPEAGTLETVRVARALNQLLQKFRTIIADARLSSLSIATASREIASGNADLSSRTQSQASSLEEAANSMGELANTVKQNADNARLADQLVGSTAEVAVKGGQVVGQVVGTMASIQESSSRIADITGVIDAIAFQTNILALNAAVEAARAGEQGRGFAVVASEVRGLAQRSANAAKEIKALIEDSTCKVNTGGQLVNEAGKTMDEIVSSVKRVTDIMSEISAASQHQRADIERVTQSVGQMDNVTQQNAALVQQAAAAAQSLQEQAAKLAEAVSAFRLEA